MPTRPTILSIALALALTVAIPATRAQQPESTTAGYVFGAGTGMLLFHVPPDHASVFEDIMVRISDGLRAASGNGLEGESAAWRFFRARPEADTAVYLAFIDPVVAGADYDPVRLLTRFAPDEARALFDQLQAAIIRVERLDLEDLR